MDHFLDIDLRPDPEFSASHLMAALHSKLHRALALSRRSDIGISFPGHDIRAPHLGSKMRLHGALDSLNALMAAKWLYGMDDHVALFGPKSVPPTAKHCAVRRLQVKSSPERLRRRLMRRHGLEAREAQRRIPDNIAEVVHLPFLQLRSATTLQTFRLFIDHKPPQDQPLSGQFNAYGLSQTATVPWF